MAQQENKIGKLTNGKADIKCAGKIISAVVSGSNRSAMLISNIKEDMLQVRSLNIYKNSEVEGDIDTRDNQEFEYIVSYDGLVQHSEVVFIPDPR